MANLRRMKAELRNILEKDDWETHLGEIAAMGQPAVGALFSFLLLDPVFMHRAACALGGTIAAIYAQNAETARNIIRRFMWHMNEDSGNIGWGIPDAFAETLARSPALAKEYGNILISYIMDLGIADNYCDNAQLRRDCYWAVGRLLQADGRFCPKAQPWLIKGLSDEDEVGRAMSLWALGQCPCDLGIAPCLRKIADDGGKYEIFDGGRMEEFTIKQLAGKALASC